MEANEVVALKRLICPCGSGWAQFERAEFFPFVPTWTDANCFIELFYQDLLSRDSHRLLKPHAIGFGKMRPQMLRYGISSFPNFRYQRAGVLDVARIETFGLDGNQR